MTHSISSTGRLSISAARPPPESAEYEPPETNTNVQNSTMPTETYTGGKPFTQMHAAKKTPDTMRQEKILPLSALNAMAINITIKAEITSITSV